MPAEDEWILFLEKNPQFYELSKGAFFISFLSKLAGSAKNFSELRRLFPAVEENDLQLILDSLLKLKVVSRRRIALDSFYSLAEDGKKLLLAYRKAKRSFSV